MPTRHKITPTVLRKIPNHREVKRLQFLMVVAKNEHRESEGLNRNSN